MGKTTAGLNSRCRLYDKKTRTLIANDNTYKTIMTMLSVMKGTYKNLDLFLA
jgi:hypothetical protein